MNAKKVLSDTNIFRHYLQTLPEKPAGGGGGQPHP